jgi:hypothetical protein
MQSNIPDYQNFPLTENFRPLLGGGKTRLGLTRSMQSRVGGGSREMGGGVGAVFGWRKKSKRFLSAESGLGTRFLA